MSFTIDTGADMPDLLTTSVRIRLKQVKSGKMSAVKKRTQNHSKTLVVKERTQNQGNLTAESSRTCFYLSKDTEKDDKDTLLKCRAVPTLAPHDSSKRKINLKMPRNTEAGTYYLISCADDSHRVEEMDEGNNCKVARNRIKVTKR